MNAKTAAIAFKIAFSSTVAMAQSGPASGSWIYNRGSRGKHGNSWHGAKQHDGLQSEWKRNVYLGRPGR
jgi:hypothetical protein